MSVVDPLLTHPMNFRHAYRRLESRIKRCHVAVVVVVVAAGEETREKMAKKENSIRVKSRGYKS